MTVIPFKPKTNQMPPGEPLFVIHIYPGDGNGFHWYVSTDDEDTLPDVEQLSGYLADMFMTLNPEPPGILDRARSFLNRLFPSKGDDE